MDSKLKKNWFSRNLVTTFYALREDNIGMKSPFRWLRLDFWYFNTAVVCSITRHWSVASGKIVRRLKNLIDHVISTWADEVQNEG